jgi:hypothetical protein
MRRGCKEDDMSDTTPALDEAFERMAAASFELPNGFVNHGAMACEALAMDPHQVKLVEACQRGYAATGDPAFAAAAETVTGLNA